MYSIPDWNAWYAIYESYQKNKRIHEDVEIHLDYVRTYTKEWFMHGGSPIIMTILGMKTCQGYCEFDTTSSVVYIDIAWFLNSQEKIHLLRNVALHELVHAARFQSGVLRMTKTLKDFFVEEGLAEYVATSITGYDLISLTQAELNETKLNTDMVNHIIQFWDKDNYDIISKLFITGDEDANIMPGTGYRVASDIVRAWIADENLSIENVLCMGTDQLSEILYTRIRML